VKGGRISTKTADFWHSAHPEARQGKARQGMMVISKKRKALATYGGPANYRHFKSLC